MSAGFGRGPVFVLLTLGRGRAAPGPAIAGRDAGDLVQDQPGGELGRNRRRFVGLLQRRRGIDGGDRGHALGGL